MLTYLIHGEVDRSLWADTADLTLAQLVTFYAAGADMPLAGTLVDGDPLHGVGGLGARRFLKCRQICWLAVSSLRQV